MRLQAADELVGQLGEPHAARIVGRVGLEEVLAVLPQAHVEVAAVARQVGERLGHERRDQPLLLGQRLDHVAEEDGAVAGDERVVELEVLLELAVGVLVVGRVVVPAQRGDVARDRRDEVQVARQAAHVVTGLLEGVQRIGDLDRAVLAPAHEEVLELGADAELVAQGRGAIELVAQDGARAVGPLLALDRHVAREAGDARLPRQRRVAAHVGHRDEVGVVGALADVSGRKAGEAGAVGEQVLEVMGRHELGVGLAVHVDELREEELDVAVTRELSDLIGALRCDQRLGHGAPSVLALSVKATSLPVLASTRATDTRV